MGKLVGGRRWLGRQSRPEDVSSLPGRVAGWFLPASRTGDLEVCAGRIRTSRESRRRSSKR